VVTGDGSREPEAGPPSLDEEGKPSFGASAIAALRAASAESRGSEAALAGAYDACLRFARQHYENFPVASRLLPRNLRKHVAAIYAFARTADDFADEPGRLDAERLRLLDDWLHCLRGCVHGRGSRSSADAARSAAMADAPKLGLPSPSSEAGPVPDAIFLALGHTIREFALPLSLFEDLLSAFRQDVTTTRYATWAEVLDYCRRSANPVGRLVLRLSGYRDDELDRRSDAVCTALQLTNFWQDLAVDWRRGRLYVPSETWRACGAGLSDLEAGRFTPAWQAALHACADRTRARFDEGRAVADLVSGRLGMELRATWLGGTRILERLERDHFNVFVRRPSLGAADAVVIGCKTLLWRRRPAPMTAEAP
jgi:phytoene synthase